MKKYLFFGLILLLSQFIMAQSSTRVHVFLDDGQFYRNVYLHTMEKEYIIINLNGPQEEEVLVRLSTSKIRNIRYLSISKVKPAEVSMEKESEGFVPGLYFMLEMGGLVGKSNSDDDNSTNLGIKGLIGYTPVSYFGAGLGLGLDNYDDFAALPVFLDVRGNLFEATVSPYYFFQVGYASAWFTDEENLTFVENDIEADWSFHPGFGFRFELGKADLLVSMGYKQQNVKITQEFEWGETLIERREMKRMTFGLGLIF